MRQLTTHSPGMSLLSGASRPAARWMACFAALCGLLTQISASTIGGRVINLSSGRPSPGDEVALYRVDRSMHEVGRARSGEQGEFRFETQNDLRYLVAVRHQGIAYHTRTMTGTLGLEVSVYDASRAQQSVREDSDTLFFDVRAGTLHVTEFFVLSNQANPPRTFVGDNTFEFALPLRSTLDSVAVQPPDTLPLEVRARARRQEGRYRIAYPIRPGLTRVRIQYSLPYSGTASLAPEVLRPVAALALKIPKSMELRLDQLGTFQQNGEDNGLSVYIAKNLAPGSHPGFSLTATGQTDSENTTADQTQSRSDVDAAYAEFVPAASSMREPGAISNRSLVLYYEIPVVFISLVILLVMLKQNREVAKNQGGTTDSFRMAERERIGL